MGYQQTLTGKHPVIDWHERHALEYSMTEKRLADTKAKFMSVSLDEAVRMHNKAYIQTVISQQNAVEKYQPALDRYFRGADMADAFASVNYNKQKISWISDTLVGIEATEEAVKILREGRLEDYCSFAEEHFTGVSFVKAPFTAAMLGFTKAMCIDTNVAQATGTNPKDIRTWEEYWSICDDICTAYSTLKTDPFIIQWILFDFQRGYHEPHKEWFEAVGTWTSLDRSVE